MKKRLWLAYVWTEEASHTKRSEVVMVVCWMVGGGGGGGDVGLMKKGGRRDTDMTDECVFSRAARFCHENGAHGASKQWRSTLCLIGTRDCG
jgi:hypothetical protein